MREIRIMLTLQVPDGVDVQVETSEAGGTPGPTVGGPMAQRHAQVEQLIAQGRYDEARAELDQLQADGFLGDPTGGEDDLLSTMELNAGEVVALRALVAAQVTSGTGLSHEQLVAVFADHPHPGKKVGNVMSSLVRRFTSSGYQPIVHKDRHGTWHVTASAATNIAGSGLLDDLADELGLDVPDGLDGQG